MSLEARVAGGELACASGDPPGKVRGGPEDDSPLTNSPRQQEREGESGVTASERSRRLAEEGKAGIQGRLHGGGLRIWKVSLKTGRDLGQ